MVDFMLFWAWTSYLPIMQSLIFTPRPTLAMPAIYRYCGEVLIVTYQHVTSILFRLCGCLLLDV